VTSPYATQDCLSVQAVRSLLFHATPYRAPLSKSSTWMLESPVIEFW
jgi:hypothetical protein